MFSWIYDRFVVQEGSLQNLYTVDASCARIYMYRFDLLYKIEGCILRITK